MGPMIHLSNMDNALIQLLLVVSLKIKFFQHLPCDLLAVVVNCSAIQYTTDQSKHFREAIVIDQSKKPFLFTIWGDLADNEGAELLHHLHEYPVILARRIGITEFRGGIFISPSSTTLIFTFPFSILN
ncbi:hypothetical protein P3S67_000826 [Capsicum chacoense]